MRTFAKIRGGNSPHAVPPQVPVSRCRRGLAEIASGYASAL